MDYSAAMEALAAPKRLKTELPPPYVFEQAGVRVELVEGRLTALCPFHVDRTPSLFMVETETGWRWGCWSCGASGDPVDLIRRFRPCYTFSQAVEAGIGLVERMRAEGWKAPMIETQKLWDAAWAKQLVREAQRNLDGVEQFIAAKRYPFGATWLADTFGVGSLNGRLIVPVYDSNRELVAVKHRATDASDHLFAFPGSKLQDTLYGGPNLALEWPVVLCEGESDVWCATFPLRGRRLEVLGTAAGAGQAPKPAALIAGRKVHICFDGDPAGRAGAARWAEELRRLRCDVTVWDLPDGSDLASLGGPYWLLDAR